MITTAMLCLVAMATLTEARTLNGDDFMLVNQMHALAKSTLDQQNANLDSNPLTDRQQSPERPVPGRSNICDSLCPKWCQKINGTATDSTNCHYLCGNICYDKKTSMNPFIGNERYEVVPSKFEFSRYDVSGDKLITVNEFAMVEDVNPAEVADMFIFTDLNGDGYIDTKEFQGGPLVFTVQMAAELSAMAMVGPITTPTPTKE